MRLKPGWVVLSAALALSAAKDGRDEGVYKILVDGREIGSERFALSVTEKGAASTSVLDFRNPSGPPTRLHFESKLEMDGKFRPRSYRLDTDVDGKKGFMLATFSPRQAMFEYGTPGSAKKSGLLVGEDYTVLDTNIFHHFIFLARRFDFNSKEKTQRFEVLIPQESDSGVVKVRDLGRDTVLVNGKKQDAHHLEVDSGAKLIELWVDRDQKLQKLAVPAIKLEVLRTH
jgi:hypothetical protein